MINNEIIRLEELLKTRVDVDRIFLYEEFQQIKGATLSDLDKLEEILGRKLPEDFREFYSWKNGSGYNFHILRFGVKRPRKGDYYLMTIEKIIERLTDFDPRIREPLSAFYSEEEIAELDNRIKPYWFSPDRPVIAEFAGGSHSLMLDFDPAQSGKDGQVISFMHDPDFLLYIAGGFTELLHLSNNNLENDYIDY